MNILIVEDENDLRELLRYHLEKVQFNVFEAENGEQALGIIDKNRIDLAILDIMMPNMDGISLLKHIRHDSYIPIIFLTSKMDDLDKIKAFENGADDYIIKPFNPSDLILRINSNLRRYYNYSNNAEVEETEKILKLGELKLNLTNCVCIKNKIEIPLKNKEFKILEMLMKSPGRVYTTKQIYEMVWADYYLNDANPVMVQISRIREKIEEDPKKPKYLKTIRGLGYKMEG